MGGCPEIADLGTRLAFQKDPKMGVVNFKFQMKPFFTDFNMEVSFTSKIA